jgi:hypothetical protein
MSICSAFMASQLGSLETVIVAGEACPRRLVESHRSRMTETRLFQRVRADGSDGVEHRFRLQPTVSLQPPHR